MSDLEDILSAEIRAMNKHLPRTRKTLRELLSEETPHVVLGDGTVHVFDRDELRRIAEENPDLVDSLRIPIIIVMRPEMGEGTGTVSGTAESELVARILGIGRQDDYVIVYRPQIRTLRRRLPTTTTYLFLPR